MEKFSIICLNPKRWDELRELRLKALQTNPSSFCSTYEEEVQYPDTRWIQWLEDAQKGETSLLFCAEYNNKLIGMIGASINQEQENASIISMFIDPHFREKGIGKLLFQTICQKLEAYPIKEINLTVNAENSAAINLYRKQGFIETGKIILHPRKSFVMAKHINQLK